MSLYILLLIITTNPTKKIFFYKTDLHEHVDHRDDEVHANQQRTEGELQYRGADLRVLTPGLYHDSSAVSLNEV